MPADVSAFILAIHRAARRVSHVEFRPWLFGELETVLRYDSGMWMRAVVTERGPQMVDSHLHRQRPDRLSSYVEQSLWQEDPFIGNLFSNGARRAWAMSSSEVPPGRLSDFLELHEQRHVVCSFEFDAVVTSVTGFAMFRRGRDDPFDEADRSLVEFVEPHLRDAWTFSWLNDIGVARGERLPHGFAQAVFTPDHVLRAADEHFVELMRREWPQWQGPYQPAAWIDHLSRHPGAAWAGHRVVGYAQVLADGLVLLRLREAHALDRLSPRKREATMLFASGASQSEVAARLRLSTSTVNNYLVDVYRALGVHDKTALAVLVARLVPPGGGRSASLI